MAVAMQNERFECKMQKVVTLQVEFGVPVDLHCQKPHTPTHSLTLLPTSSNALLRVLLRLLAVLPLLVLLLLCGVRAYTLGVLLSVIGPILPVALARRTTTRPTSSPPSRSYCRG
jgi:hypothetical protein